MLSIYKMNFVSVNADYRKVYENYKFMADTYLQYGELFNKNVDKYVEFLKKDNKTGTTYQKINAYGDLYNLSMFNDRYNMLKKCC